MEENYPQYEMFEEKNIRKISIDLEHTNYGVLTHPKFEVEKDVNFLEEEKPSANFILNKNNINSTNIFQISNIKENNHNENKSFIIPQNITENNNSQNVSDEKIKINSSKENENSESNQNEYNSGRWTNEEHQKFIEGILKYGNEWKRVQSIIKTRSSTQARSHAQKFFLRLKKEISPKILADPNQLLEYIITSTNKAKNYTNLTPEQKERLFSVIRSNLKPEESQNRNINIYNTNQYINKNRENESGLDYIKEEEYDNLAYNKENIINKKMSISDIGEKRKITFCSKKRKNSSDYILSINENRIFNIQKDMNHKRSMDITKKSDIFVNNLTKNNIEKKNSYNEFNNSINNNLYINNNNNINNNLNNINNNNFISGDKYTNKSSNNNCSTNFIIQNNYYNIINNYNNNMNNNQGNINFNANNFQNAYINNDSINSDYNNQNKNYVNNIDNLKIKDKNIKNNNLEYSDNEKNINPKNILENYSFLNNENFFPVFNKSYHYESTNKNYDNMETNDPFNLKFENAEVHNDNNTTINNENISLNNNLEVGHDIDYEFDNFERNNNGAERPFDE